MFKNLTELFLFVCMKLMLSRLVVGVEIKIEILPLGLRWV